MTLRVGTTKIAFEQLKLIVFRGWQGFEVGWNYKRKVRSFLDKVRELR